MLPDLRSEGDFFGRGGGFADVFSADLAGYLMPTRLHPLFGAWIRSLPFPNDKGQQIFIGYVALALGVVGVVANLRLPRRLVRAQTWLWLTAFLCFWLLSLGPSLRWMGHDLQIPGPFALLSRVPFFSGNRYPSRYSVMVMLCLAVLSAYGMVWFLLRVLDSKPWAKWRASGWIYAAAGLPAMLFLFGQISIPLPLNDLGVPAVYRWLAQQPGDFAILELPTGWRNGARVLGRSDVLIMMQQWYQTIHGKRRLGGNTSRNPDFKFQYFTDAPLLGDLIALMNGDQAHLAPVVADRLPELVAHDRPLAGDVLNFLGIHYVVLHTVVQGDAAPEALVRFVHEALPVRLVQRWQGVDLERPNGGMGTLCGDSSAVGQLAG